MEETKTTEQNSNSERVAGYKDFGREDETTMGEQKFYVAGAGHIIFSLSTNVMTGGATGFSLGVSWGKYGETGGVLDTKEAKLMADFIYERIGIKQAQNSL